jgi:hypothetical protein
MLNIKYELKTVLIFLWETERNHATPIKGKYKMVHPISQMLKKCMNRDMELQVFLSGLLLLHHNEVSSITVCFLILRLLSCGCRNIQ